MLPSAGRVRVHEDDVPVTGFKFRRPTVIGNRAKRSEPRAGNAARPTSAPCVAGLEAQGDGSA